MTLAVTLVNLTPHRINVLEGERIVATIPPSGRVARLEQEPVAEQLIVDPAVPLVTIRYGACSELPPEQPGVRLVVSRIVATEVQRADLVFPDLEVRDHRGAIIGCRRLARYQR